LGRNSEAHCRSSAKVFDRVGRAEGFNKVRWSGVASDDSIKGCYVVRCRSESGERFDVLALRIPAAWDSSLALNERIQFHGFLYAKTSRPGGIREKEVPTFVCHRLGWLPDQENEALDVGTLEVALAEQGVDIGMLDVVRSQHLKPLGYEDAGTFFQLLSAIRKIDPRELESEIGIDEVISESTKYFFQPIQFVARVKQCVPIRVASASVREEIGGDQYFQLMVFPNLKGQQIVVKNPRGDDLVYERFPVTVCAHELPGDLFPSEMENQQIQVSGIFFRFWSYRSDRTDASGLAGQISPLIIANKPVLIVNDTELINSLIMGIVIAAMISLGLLMWYLRRANRAVRGGSVEPAPVDFRGIE
jgi:hypothetical protein